MPPYCEYVVNSPLKAAYAILALFSMLSSLTIPIIYKISKRTRHHPAGILVLICICEIVCCYHLMIWAMDINNFLCFFDFYQMAEVWTINSVDDNDEQSYYQTECWFNQITYFSALYLQFTLYILLCIDLILTLWKPFISGQQRIQWYIPIGILSTIILTISTYPNLEGFCNKYEQNYYNPTQNDEKPVLEISYPPVLLTEMIFYLSGILSIVMAINNRRKTKYLVYPQLAKAKDQYIKNHIILIFVIFVIWMVPFYNNIDMQINKISGYPINSTLNVISFMILLSQGIFITFVRLSEPYFRLRLYLLIKQLFCCKVDKELIKEREAEDQKDTDNWNFSLATLMGRMQNQDLVKGLLLGIIQIIKYETGASVIEGNCNIFPSEEIMHKWINDKKAKRFYLNASQELIEIQNSLRKSFVTKHSDTHNKEPILSVKDGFIINVEEYAPKVFHLLRKFQQFSIDMIMESLNLDKNEQQIAKAQKSMGKSGSFFFFSHDHKLILKTISETEIRVLIQKFLIPYCFHTQKYKNQLIARVYGIYTLIIEGVSPVHLIMMENSLEGLEEFGGCVRSYDLKGSLINRFVKIDNRSKQLSGSVSSSFSSNQSMFGGNGDVEGQKTQNRVLKDLNFIYSEDLFVMLEQNDRERLMEQLKIDSEFLNGLKIMDYSMLLGIAEPMHIEKQMEDYNPRCLREYNRNMISIAIIDYLQLFDTKKYLEYKYKTLIKNRKSDLISCVFPDQYQTRFFTFMNSIFCSMIVY